MANLVKLTVLDGGRLTRRTGSMYFNTSRIISFKTVTAGTLLFYNDNRNGWREKPAKILVSDSYATIAAAAAIYAPGNRISVSILQKGSDVYASAVTGSLCVDDIVLAYANPGNTSTQTYLLLQHGIWTAVEYVISSSIAAFYNASKKITDGVNTLVVTIGSIGSTTDDYKFTSAANTTEQVITLTGAIPAFARILDWAVITTTAFTGITGLTTAVGTTSSGTELVTDTSNLAANTILSGAIAGAPYLAGSATAQNIFISCNPTGNWSTMTGGQLKVVITYVDRANA